MTSACSGRLSATRSERWSWLGVLAGDVAQELQERGQLAEGGMRWRPPGAVERLADRGGGGGGGGRPEPQHRNSGGTVFVRYQPPFRPTYEIVDPVAYGSYEVGPVAYRSYEIVRAPVALGNYYAEPLTPSFDDYALAVDLYLAQLFGAALGQTLSAHVAAIISEVTGVPFLVAKRQFHRILSRFVARAIHHHARYYSAAVVEDGLFRWLEQFDGANR